MESNRFYDPFSALKKKANPSSEKKLFEQNGSIIRYLLRRDNNEKIYINRNVFRLGSKRETCDYTVTDNKYVGRNHAQILLENGAAYFVDNNSTNKSYINGKQAMPNQKIILKNGDEIKLANLPFVYIIEVN